MKKAIFFSVSLRGENSMVTVFCILSMKRMPTMIRLFFIDPVVSPFSIYFFVSNPCVIFELVSFRFKSSLSFRALFPFQVLSSSWKSCLSFEATSCLLEATSSFRSLLCCGWLAGRKRMDPCFGFKSSLSFEIMSFVRNHFFENFCFLFEVLSFRLKSCLSFGDHSFRSKSSLSFEALSWVQSHFFVSNLLCRFKPFLFVRNPFSVFNLLFRFKSFRDI